MIDLNEKVEALPYMRETQVQKLAKLGIHTVIDFLYHFPARYDDLSKIVTISELVPDQSATINGEITNFSIKRSWRKKMSIIEIQLDDGTGKIRATWFNQNYLIDTFAKHKHIRISGKAKLDDKGFHISNPIWEIAHNSPNHTGRIVPIYPETKGISSKWLRYKIEEIFKNDFEIEDPLEEMILEKYNLPSLQKALTDIHFPKSENSYLVAQKRFAFFDMFLIQLRALQIKNSLKKESAPELKYEKKKTEGFIQSFPFTLTRDQEKATEEIRKDLAKNHPMNRLLNGDVGSGKTIVAALASLQSVYNGFQVSIMAPTEVLAYQHFKSFSQLFSNFNLTVGLLTNSYKLVQSSRSVVHSEKDSSVDNSKLIQNSKLKIKKISTAPTKFTREKMLEYIKNGSIDILIGTHAIIQKDIEFNNLALIIIDEQHRFGVNQRSFLQQQVSRVKDGIKNKSPHFLTMTATPIPRTISMTLLGSLDVSLIAEMPKNRLPIITQIILPPKQNIIYEFIRQEIKRGHQAFVILPLVEESDKIAEVKAAITEHERLSRDVFSEFNLGLLHGRMKSKEKEEIMLDFKNKKIDILVSTSVIEVGIDIPNATVMIIEEAYRFGLSQLHQFRGRVGRGREQSYCFLFSKNSTPRLKILAKYSDGFTVAEKDLKLRGPGDFLGNRQSGLADSTMQNITNIKMIKCANLEAQKIIAEDITLKNNRLLKESLEKMNQNIHLE